MRTLTNFKNEPYTLCNREELNSLIARIQHLAIENHTIITESVLHSGGAFSYAFSIHVFRSGLYAEVYKGKDYNHAKPLQGKPPKYYLVRLMRDDKLVKEYYAL